jgi:hypothetical protein
VIIPILVARGDNDSLKAWLDEWKLDSCTCLRVIAVLDISGAKEGDAERLEVELLAGRAWNKEILTFKGSFGSPGAARNKGLSNSFAQWVAFWDSDDTPEIGILEVVLGNLKQSLTSLHVYQYESWSLGLGRRVRISDDRNVRRLARWPGLWRVIVPGQIARQFSFPTHLMGEDVAYLVQLLNSGLIDEIRYHPEKIYRYNIYSEGQLTNSNTALKGHGLALDSMSKTLDNHIEVKPSIRRFATLIFIYQYLSLFKRDPKEALKRSRLLIKVLLSNFRTHSKSFSSDQLKKKNAGQVYLYLTGGLGNQLFQYAAARYYGGDKSVVKIIRDAGTPRSNSHGEPMIAELIEVGRGETEFISLGKKKALFARLSNILLRINIHESAILNNWLIRTFLSLAFQPIFSFILHKKVRLLVCHGHGYFAKLKSRRDNYLVIGYFQSYEYAESIKSEVMEKLTSIKQKSLTSKVHFNTLDAPEALVIHIRRGDYLLETKIGCLDNTYFLGILSDIRSFKDFEEVWVIVEDEVMAQFLQTELPKNTYIFTAEMLDTLETLTLMSLGESYIISNSTFSWWGAFLSNNQTPKSQVIAPSPWYREIKEPERFILETWKESPAIWMNK